MRARRGGGGALARRGAGAGQPLARLTDLRELRADVVGGATGRWRWHGGKVDGSAGLRVGGGSLGPHSAGARQARQAHLREA